MYKLSGHFSTKRKRLLPPPLPPKKVIHITRQPQEGALGQFTKLYYLVKLLKGRTTSESETFQQKETRRSQQKDLLVQTPRRDYISYLGRERLGVLPDKLEEVAEVRLVWASLLVLLPPRPCLG